jgi:hypothetical protein
MKSLALRVLLVVLALAAQAGAGYTIWGLDRQNMADRAASSAIDHQARLLESSLAEVASSQQAYVAAGQDVDFWVRKAGGVLQSLPNDLATLRQAVRTPDAQAALESVTEQLTGLARLDERARELVKAGQQLSASDLIFTDGAQIVGRSMVLLNDARTREIANGGATEATRRWTALYLAGGALSISLLVLLALVAVPKVGTAETEADEDDEGAGLGLSRVPRAPGRVASERLGSAQEPAVPVKGPRETIPSVLSETARLCTALAGVREMAELPQLLEQAAKLLDAAGLIVWIADRPGGDLHAAVAYGYSAQILARMGSVAANADNATATSFRTGTVQSVPGDVEINGALAVPLSTALGVAGVLAAEVRHRREVDHATRELAIIIAAQLATLFTPAPASGAHS